MPARSASSSGHEPPDEPGEPRPRIDGLQIARIAGPPGEEIHTDAFGRIKLSFPWDRRAKGDGTDTGWVRVSQSWGGTSWGQQIIPRVGMEALVAYQEGDPDRPIVVGIVPNPNTPVPYKLLKNRLDARGNRIERRIEEGLVRIGRDPLGALASLTIDEHAPLSFSRDALGRETRRASERGFRLDQAFDPVGQLMRESAGSESLAGRTYAWDKAGAPTLIDDRLFGPASYRYDANGRVAQAKFGEQLTERFDYDAAKNVVGVSVEGPEAGAGLGALLNVRSTPRGVVQLSHGPNGESVALTHDVCGRVIERRVERKGFRPRTWRYGWDALDRLVSCLTPEGERWFYRYDPFGRRLSKVRAFSDTERAWVAKKHPALVSAADREATVLWTWPQAPNGHAAHDPRPPIVGTYFLWDGDVIAEEAPLRLDGGIDWGGATRWHFEPESFVPIAKQMPDGRLAWIVTDHLGTPREMFDEKGQLRWAASLTAWGVVRKVITPAAPANDDGRSTIYPRSLSHTITALQHKTDAATYNCSLRFQGQ